MRIIKLTDVLDNPIWVNMDTVKYFRVKDYENGTRMGVEISFIDGSFFTVQECVREIKRLMEVPL